MPAPSMPGSTRRLNSGLCTLPKLWCEIAEAPVVTVSAKCTVALAVTGGTPAASRKDEAVSP